MNSYSESNLLDVTELSHEMINEYLTFANRPSLSVTEYLQFRQVAANEIQNGLAPNRPSRSVESSYQPALPEQNAVAPVKRAPQIQSPVTQEAKQIPSEEIESAQSKEDAFFDLIKQIDS